MEESILFRKILSKMKDEDLEHIKNVVMKHSVWKRYFEKYKHFGFESHMQIKSFIKWQMALEKKEEQKKLKSNENNLIHNKPYWYDKNRDVYVVHLPNKKKPFALNGDFWRSIKESYSNWDNSPSSINEACRKFGLPRNTLILLLRVMGVTHDSAPWTDEEINQTEEEELVQDLIRRKEEKVLVRAQKIEWDKIKKDAFKFRNLNMYCKSIKFQFENFQAPKYSVPKIKIKESKKPYSIVISPTDFHWGKYAPKYSGDSYNRVVAKERLFKSTEKLINRVHFRGKPDKIFLAIGGDGLHIDNQGRSTTRGTLQDVDGTPTELASSYVQLCREYIDYLSQVADVEVFIVPGNHDYYTSTLLREAIKGWYNKSENVKVFDSLNPRQSVLYGNSLITFMHGDEGQVKDYPAIIASESSTEWGASKWRFIFTGHLHTERELPTFGNVTVYRMPSLAGTDDWHFRKGYKSRKALIAYILDLKEGVIASEICPIS